MSYHGKDEIVNATIGDTMLGIEDHGIFTCVLFLDYGDSSTQGFGTYDLRGAWGTEFLQKMLEAIGVNEWEKLKGTNVRVRFGKSSAGLGNEIVAIGHITRDKWFEPKKLAKKYFPEEKGE